MLPPPVRTLDSKAALLRGYPCKFMPEPPAPVAPWHRAQLVENDADNAESELPSLLLLDEVPHAAGRKASRLNPEIIHKKSRCFFILLS